MSYHCVPATDAEYVSTRVRILFLFFRLALRNNSPGTAPSMADPSLPPSSGYPPYIWITESAPLDPLRWEHQTHTFWRARIVAERRAAWGWPRIRNTPALGFLCIVVGFSPSASNIRVSLSLTLRDCDYDARCSETCQDVRTHTWHELSGDTM